MKKLISATILLVLCFTLFSQAVFADGLSTEKLSLYAVNGAKSIYAENQEEIAKKFESIERVKAFYEKFGLKIDPKTIMPIYTADVYEYARTGNLKIQPYRSSDGGQRYIADLLGSAGVIIFTIDGDDAGVMSFTGSGCSDFNKNIGKMTKELDELKFDSKSTEAKVFYSDAIGYAYYFTDGTDKAFIYADVTGGDASEHYFFGNDGLTKSSDGTAVLLDEKFVKHKLEEYRVMQEALQSKDKYNTSTGGDDTVAYATLGVVLISLCAVCEIKRRRTA